MRKFILWISMSIFLGVITVAIMSMDGSVANAKKKKAYRCPISMVRVEIVAGSPAEYTIVDDNENGFICINKAGQIVDDGAVPVTGKKKK